MPDPSPPPPDPPPSPPPPPKLTAQPLTLVAQEDIQASGGLAADNPNGGTLTYTVISEPVKGEVLVTNRARGTFTYTPSANENGADRFDFRVTNGTETATATVSVSILPVNDIPTVGGTCDITSLDQALSGDLNDLVADVDNTEFNFSLLTDGEKGSVNLDPSGVFTYDPNDGARGKDRFTYQVDDLNGGTDTATVEIIVGRTRIMPLGDSITEGTLGRNPPLTGPDIIPPEQRVGYRRALYKSLGDAGYAIDFVGSLSDGAQANPPIVDPHHEGHGGQKDEFIAQNVMEFLTTNPADLVLLHIGTNDLNSNPPDTAADDVETILDNIDAWEQANRPVTVFLALITDRRSENNQQELPNPDVDMFNANIQALARNRISAGDDLVIVNQHTALKYPDDLAPDQVHPDQAGYDKMARQWFAAIKSSGKIPQCPPAP